MARAPGAETACHDAAVVGHDTTSATARVTTDVFLGLSRPAATGLFMRGRVCSAWRQIQWGYSQRCSVIGSGG
jgi:hypothetical protein